MSDDPDSTSPHSNGVTITVKVAAPAWRARIPGASRLACRAARAAFTGAEGSGRVQGSAEISLLLADDATVRRLNQTYRGRDEPTNVLSFPCGDSASAGGHGPALLGDVVLAVETVCREAIGQGKAVDDHFCHLVVHGVLHLLGHGHGADDEAEIMERLETEILCGLGVSDPHARAGSLETGS